MFSVDQIHLAAKVSVLSIDKSGGITERDRRESMAHQEFRLFIINKPSRTDLIQDFRKNAELNNPATRIWKTMLPVPGSRYAQR